MPPAGMPANRALLSGPRLSPHRCRRERLFKKINEHPTVYKTLSGEGGAKGGSKKKVRSDGIVLCRSATPVHCPDTLALARRAGVRQRWAASGGRSVTTASGRCETGSRRAAPTRLWPADV